MTSIMTPLHLLEKFVVNLVISDQYVLLYDCV